ncbi:hypothetical protein MYK68_03220 [Gordonia sp. PP30]|uniref:hypothetical protein n=1 Tax=Gordonia sp. PP30 TaxID=2935861 RepID=UPI001FFE69A7|nr:hypothetical protein [Gordonia sp. PP30]UQE75645.1 hypothetical protein MYK68_03220 [Gordonia sp. PP30]
MSERRGILQAVKRTIIAATATLTLFLTGCSSTDDAAPPAGESSAPAAAESSAPKADESSAQAAERIKADVPSVTHIVEITEDNDGNDLIGRPNGYSAATVLVDRRTKCDDAEKPATSCGAMIEQWASKSDAEKRKKYIDDILKASPMLGSEYSTVKGNLLLRVTGKLKPSEAEAYRKAFLN